MNYAWPGNVRELKNVIESAVLFAAGPRIDVADLPPAVRAAAPEPADARTDAGSVAGRVRAGRLLVGKTMAEIEKEAILTTLQVSGGNRRRAAEMLDIGLRTLQRKLKEYRGETGDDDDEDSRRGHGHLTPGWAFERTDRKRRPCRPRGDD